MARIIDQRNTDYKGEKPFRVDYQDNEAKRHRVRFRTKKEAENFLHIVEAENLKAAGHRLTDWFGEKQRKDITVEEIYQYYEDKKIKLNRRPDAQRTMRKSIKPFVERFGKVKASQLTVPMIDDFKVDRMKDGKEELTVQTQTAAFKTMLRWAFKRECMLLNPAQECEVGKRASPKRRRWALTEDDIRKMIIGLQEHSRDILYYFILAVNTGMRIRELWSLEWNQVDIDSSPPYLYLPRDKVKNEWSERKVPSRLAASKSSGSSYLKDGRTILSFLFIGIWQLSPETSIPFRRLYWARNSPGTI